MNTPLPLTLTPTGPTPERRARLTQIVRLLVAATITYNVIEAIVAITAGTIASSTALIGFGLDSVIEVSSAAAVAWQFSARDPEVREAREHRALRIIAVSFFALAAYITFESVRAFFGGAEAEHSTVGLVLAAVSLAVQADTAVHLPVRGPARRARAQQPVRLVLGRPHRRPRHRRRRRQGRHRSVEGRQLLRPSGCPGQRQDRSHR
jgi:hypothetical protein